MKKNCNVWLFWDILDHSFEFNMLIDTSLNDPHLHQSMRMQKITYFLADFSVDLSRLDMLLQPRLLKSAECIVHDQYL